MFGVAGGAGWPSAEDEAVTATAGVAAAAVSGSTGSEFEIILPSPRSHFSLCFFPLSLFLALSTLRVVYFAGFSFLGPLIFKQAKKKEEGPNKPTRAKGPIHVRRTIKYMCWFSLTLLSFWASVNERHCHKSHVLHWIMSCKLSHYHLLSNE